jgi:hypothetical protein
MPRPELAPLETKASELFDPGIRPDPPAAIDALWRWVEQGRRADRPSRHRAEVVALFDYMDALIAHSIKLEAARFALSQELDAQRRAHATAYAEGQREAYEYALTVCDVAADTYTAKWDIEDKLRALRDTPAPRPATGEETPTDE